VKSRRRHHNNRPGSNPGPSRAMVPGSGGTTGGTAPVTMAAARTITGANRRSLHDRQRRKNLRKQPETPRILMTRKRPRTTGHPRRAGVTPAAVGHPRRLLRNGRTTRTASRDPRKNLTPPPCRKKRGQLKLFFQSAPLKTGVQWSPFYGVPFTTIPPSFCQPVWI